MRVAARAAGVLVAGALLVACTVLAQSRKEEAPPKTVAGETIGEFRLDMSQAMVLRQLGEPGERGAETHSPTDDRYRETWGYDQIGLHFVMSSETKGAAKTVLSIRCIAPCGRKTSRGIGVGSTLAQVRRAYAAEYDKEASEMYDGFVARGDLLFSLDGGKVRFFQLGLPD